MATRQKERKWLYVDYEKILRKLIEIYAEQEKVNVKVKIERKWTQMKRKLDKNKVYAFIGRATVRLTAWILSVYATYGISLWILNDCITVYR